MCVCVCVCVYVYVYIYIYNRPFREGLWAGLSSEVPLYGLLSLIAVAGAGTGFGLGGRARALWSRNSCVMTQRSGIAPLSHASYTGKLVVQS